MTSCTHRLIYPKFKGDCHELSSYSFLYPIKYNNIPGPLIVFPGRILNSLEFAKYSKFKPVLRCGPLRVIDFFLQAMADLRLGYGIDLDYLQCLYYYVSSKKVK
jgi:hypothetical protein